MTDEQWRKLEWEDEYFSTLEKEYKSPRFDPFVELDPPLSIIKESIKKLKQQAYGYQNTIRDLKSAGFLAERVSIGEPWDSMGRSPIHQGPEAWLSKTISKIKNYEFRLRNRERTGSWEPVEHSGTIGEDLIRRAKEVPITSLYTGRLKRSGSNLVGLCPFHSERGASFYIYQQDNRWTCFGACGTSGDAIDMVMRLQDLDFIGAVKYLNND